MPESEPKWESARKGRTRSVERAEQDKTDREKRQRSQTAPPQPKRTTCPWPGWNKTDVTQQHINRCPLKPAPVAHIVPDHLKEIPGKPAETLNHLVFHCPQPQVVEAREQLGIDKLFDLGLALRQNDRTVLYFMDAVLKVFIPTDKANLKPNTSDAIALPT